MHVAKILANGVVAGPLVSLLPRFAGLRLLCGINPLAGKCFTYWNNLDLLLLSTSDHPEAIDQ